VQVRTDQYISVDNILGIKLCLAVQPTSEGSVRLWALCRRLWPVALGAVRAGKGHGGGCTYNITGNKNLPL